MAEGDLGLLERMRRTRSGWGEDDLSRLYRSFGFREITRPVHLIVFMSTLTKDVEYYGRLPWKVEIEPERQEDGTIIYIASHPEFEGVLGSGATPEAALADLRAARRAMIEALLAEGYPVPEPAAVFTP
jgi:predicted RNase H-like HicB family nuclease